MRWLFLLLTLTSCGTVNRMNALMNESTESIHANRQAIERNTNEIRENRRLIDSSTNTIKENHHLLERLK